ncbi:MAG: hypothetical protein RBT37_07130 [Dissulfurispiraceae bacterium]|jgi:hypothetical protein|nr:hypothetical protein [Dissulfurispiraceae bacterium]
MISPKISEILQSAVMAPSSCNCQPWRFEVRGNIIKIFNMQNRDESLFNYLQRASLLAHGALIENAVICSRASGFDPDVRLLPDRARPDLIAEIELLTGTRRIDPLYEFIPQRATNRSQYSAAPLSEKENNKLLNQAFWFPHLGFKIGCTDAQKKMISTVTGFNSSICLENRELHRFLFNSIRWTKNSAEKTRDGLYINSLGLSFFEKLLLCAAKPWIIAKCMNRLGLSAMASRKAAGLCISSAAVCVITAPDDSALNFIESGRLLQRVILEAARTGLSTQIIAGAALLIQKVLSDDTSGLSNNQVSDLLEHDRHLRSAFDVSDDTIILCLRIGRSQTSAPGSLRIQPQKITTTL